MTFLVNIYFCKKKIIKMTNRSLLWANTELENIVETQIYSYRTYSLPTRYSKDFFGCKHYTHQGKIWLCPKNMCYKN